MKKTLIAGATVAVITLTLGACSSDDNSSDSSSSGTKASSGKSAVCSTRDDLQQSIDSLVDPTLLTGGKSGIQSAVDNLKSNVDDVGKAAKQDYQPQVDAVKSALDQLSDAVGNLGQGQLSDNLADIGTAVTKVGTTTSALTTKLKADCPSG